MAIEFFGQIYLYLPEKVHSEQGANTMRDSVLMDEFKKYHRAIKELQDVANVQTQHLLGMDARIRCWEQMLLPRGRMFWLAVKNIFSPDAVRLELLERFKAASQAAAPRKDKDTVEIKRVTTDAELQAELAKGAK